MKSIDNEHDSCNHLASMFDIIVMPYNVVDAALLNVLNCNC